MDARWSMDALPGTLGCADRMLGEIGASALDAAADDLFAATQPECLAAPLAIVVCPVDGIDRAIFGPLPLALGTLTPAPQRDVFVLVASRRARSAVLLRLTAWMPSHPLPWADIRTALTPGSDRSGVGVEDCGAATLHSVITPGFWHLDPDTTTRSVWQWADVVCAHDSALEPGRPAVGPADALDQLWRSVESRIHWVLEALPSEVLALHRRGVGDAPFWLVAAWSDLIDRFPHGSRERTHLTRFATTAPLPLLTMAITHDDGDALIETVVAGRSLMAFFARWPEVPRGVWRRVMREADAVPDLDPDEFRSSLCALAVIGAGRWPHSRDAWHSLAALAGALLGRSAGVCEQDAERWGRVLRALWDPDSPGDAVWYRRLRDAAALVACLGGKPDRGLRPVEVLCRMLAVGRGPTRCAPATTGSVAIGVREEADGASIEIVDTPQLAAAWGRTFNNCLRSRAVGAGYLRRGTLLAVVSKRGSPVAMVAFEAHAAGDGRFRLKLVEAHGHGSAAIDEATVLSIEQLLGQEAMQAVEAAS